MAETRKAPVVCQCESYGCKQKRYKDKDGNWQRGGSIVDRRTRDHHAVADARTAALLDQHNSSSESDKSAEEAQESGNDSSSEDLPPDQSHNLDSQVDPDRINLSETTSPDKVDHPKYDCGRFYAFSLVHAEPAILHISLLAAILSIFGDSSVATSSWFLKSTRGLLELLVSHGLHTSVTKPPNHREKKAIGSIPNDIRTVIKWLQIDPLLVRVVCCPTCFALYLNNANTPRHCVHQLFPLTDQEESDTDALQICGAELFRTKKKGLNPIRMYAFQNLYDWIARLLSRPGVEETLEISAKLSAKSYDPTFPASDIQHSKIWREFLGPDGTQFTKNSSNLTFGMFMDGINPYGNRQAGKHASITFIVLVCFSLPIEMRYLPQNIFVVGIAPGPKEPSLEQTNWIIRPIVEQLKVLWNRGLLLSQTHLFPKGRRIFSAVLPFFADLPALRRALGFAAPTATRMCSYCLLKKSEITNLDPQTWPPRNATDHKYWATQSRDADNQKTRDNISREQGVRYSVMLELPYWDIIKYHVVDSMHNLLLGLLKWHCQRFWCMSELDDKDQPKAILTTELMDLLAAGSSLTSNVPRPLSPTKSESDTNDVPFNLMEFRSTESSDDTFTPYLGDGGWGGPWTPPSDEEGIFNKETLLFINKLLPRICIPTRIKRALPVLGKASFGRLKADEWRNLFTIQLPLILPVYWATGGATARSLFRNFAHLVSLVNLALKRSTTSELVQKYRYHNLEYLKSCLILFPSVTLAPNHHMSIHLADCLNNFGPSRGWWSFSMERLMGDILKSSHNNRLGQLEISFQLNFARVGNLQALMSQPEKFPSALRPSIGQLKALISNPTPDDAALIPKSRQGFLDAPTCKLLIMRINELFRSPDGAQWISSSKWSKKQPTTSDEFLPVNSAIEKLLTYSVEDSVYCTVDQNKNNSVVMLKPSCNLQYGLIIQMFTHRRSSRDQSTQSDTWLVLNSLVPCNVASGNPFSKLDQFDLQLTLRIIDHTTKYVVHVSEVLTQCAWIKYWPSEITPEITTECVALVSLER